MLAPYLALGSLLRKLRVEAGLNQRQLAVLLHTSHSAISRLESGRHLPRLETLASYAHALHLHLFLGFSRKGEPPLLTRIV